MAETKLPFEVKRLIYDYADLPTIKSLRLASRDWAAVGIELLFLPTFIVKSPVKDLTRLINAGTSLEVARQAAKTIRTISFWSNDWDPVYLRSIVCSRHVHLQTYEVLHFVPTKEEQAALEELDVLIQQRKIDEDQGESTATLASAFKQVPHLQTLHFTCPNSFKHPILRKVWDEYDLETYREPYHQGGALRLLNIFSAATEAGLNITKVQHEKFHEEFFFDESHEPVSWDFASLTKNLRSLTLGVDDVGRSLSDPLNLVFRADPAENIINNDTIPSTPVSQDMIALPYTIEYFSLKIESLDQLPLELVPTPAVKLHTLSLVGASIVPGDFLPFITTHAPQLRRLHLGSMELRIRQSIDGFDYSWEMFLSILRDAIGNGKQLEKFQLSGHIRASLAGGPSWMLWPIYRTDSEEWEDMPWRGERARGKEVERFVVGGGAWPMLDEDNIPRLA
ncbi:hypothetical protein VTL71DRAFT_8164 [Oculimacula yallundae]|uniref:F-box domain-containing protein n=1 Tax=Oculimacula yallundae TaxID=86028 RepID=A0ABR4CZ30_9HELO